MIELQPRYSMEEFAQRGSEIYERQIKPLLHESDRGKYVLIDIETGDYEMDEDEIAAADRLRARRPGAQVWMEQVGMRGARRFGARGLGRRSYDYGQGL